MLIALALPFTVFIPKWDYDLIIPLLFLLLCSYSLIKIGYITLLSTNNPADRKNFFSINKRYNSKMKGSITDYGLNAIELQEPTTEEIINQKKKERKNKLKKIYESKI